VDEEAGAVNLPAIIQTAVLIVCLYRRRSTRYTAFLVSLAAALPFLWITPDLFPEGADWERRVWLPCAFVLIPAQAVAALEAFFRFAERYWAASRISAVASSFSVAGVIAFLVWPHGDTVGQVIQVARYQRLGCVLFLIVIVAIYALTEGIALLVRRDGHHLILLMMWMVTWAVPILRPIPPTWAEWLSDTWMVTARAWLLVLWLLAVILRPEAAVQSGRSGSPPEPRDQRGGLLV